MFDGPEKLPRSIPPTGGDYFALALDHLMRRMGLAGNVCRLVLRLDEPLDKERFRSVLDRSDLINWLSRLHLRRRFPFLVHKCFTCNGQAALILREHAVKHGGASDEVPHIVPSHRGLSPNRAPGLAFDVVDHPDGSTSIMLSWHHALMDALGAELLFQHLNRSAACNDPADQLLALTRPDRAKSTLQSLLGFPRKLARARQAVLFVTHASRVPIASLIRPQHQLTRPRGAKPDLRGERRAKPDLRGARGAEPDLREGRRAEPDRARYDFVSFDEPATARIDAHGERIGAGYHKGLFYLAATIRAFDRALRHRGSADGAYVVPVPQDLRKRGSLGPVFANRVTFQFYRVERGQTGSLRETYHILREQMIDQLRRDIPQSYVAMMELFRNVPLGLYSKMLRGPTEGQLSSFFFSFTGEACQRMDRFLGVRVRTIRHMAPLAYPPGVGVVFSRHLSRLCATVSFLEGCFEPRELTTFGEALRSDLIDGDTP